MDDERKFYEYELIPLLKLQGAMTVHIIESARLSAELSQDMAAELFHMFMESDLADPVAKSKYRQFQDMGD